jgi:26S proteasome regulatory subunit N10
MRNGDFLPTRLDAQAEAVQLICGAKTRGNPENTVSVMTLADRYRFAYLSAVQSNVRLIKNIVDGYRHCGLTYILHSPSRCEMLATLTQDLGKILTSMHDLKIGGKLNLLDGLQIAQVCA